MHNVYKQILMKKMNHLDGSNGYRKEVGDFFENVIRQILGASKCRYNDGIILETPLHMYDIGVEVKSSNSRDRFSICNLQFERHLENTGFILIHYIYVLCSYSNSRCVEGVNRRAISKCKPFEINSFLFRRLSDIIILDIKFLEEIIPRWNKIKPRVEVNGRNMHHERTKGKILKMIADRENSTDFNTVKKSLLLKAKTGLFEEESAVNLVMVTGREYTDRLLLQIGDEKKIEIE